MGTIHLLIMQQNDYLNEYPLFFYNNLAKFTSNGIAIPWLEQDRGGFVKQVGLINHARNLANSKQDESDYLKYGLSRNKSLLLMAPPGELMAASQIAEFIRNNKITGWENLTMHCAWFPAPKSLDVEGAFRSSPTEQTKSALFASLEKDVEERLSFLKDVLQLADSVTILPEPFPAHLDVSSLLEALRLPLEAQGLIPINNARINSRELFWFSNKLARAGISRQKIADALKPLDSPFIEPFLDVDKLNLFDSLYRKEIEKIASKYGAKLRMPEPFINNRDWEPFTKPTKEKTRELIEKFLESIPEEADFSRCIISNTPKTVFAVSSPEPSSPTPLLSVLTLAKNQEKYIGECIESVAMQKTDFPIRHIIVDDFSTDGTRRLIWQYSQKYRHIRPVFMPSNRSDGENVRSLFESCDTTYAALCDGDDYFTDPLKLQKQVDFLEANPQCALCFHPVDVIYEDGSPSRVYPPVDMLPGGEKPIYTLKDLLAGNIIQTNSVVYRWRFKEGLPTWFAATLLPGDWYWHILHAELGAIGYLRERMAVYRRHPKSLYALAEVGHTQNRARHGMKELEFYDTLDRHFKRGMQEPFFNFANGVFADFLKVYVETGDASLLNEACQRYPVFGKRFLREIQIN